MQVAPQILTSAIVSQAPNLKPIFPWANAPALLSAICDNESSFGRDCNPRLEASYLRGSVRKYLGIDPTGANGRWYSPDSWQSWGIYSACSHGPTQIMGAVLWDLGYRESPDNLFRDSVLAMIWTIRYMGARARGATMVEQVGDAYNSGSFRDRFQPRGYMQTLVTNYNRWVSVYPNG